VPKTKNNLRARATKAWWELEKEAIALRLKIRAADANNEGLIYNQLCDRLSTVREEQMKLRDTGLVEPLTDDQIMARSLLS
jgi:hypothetical protein